MPQVLISDIRLPDTPEATPPRSFLDVIRVGPAYQPPAGYHAPHRHERLHQLVWLTAGHLTLTIDEATYALGPDTLYVVAAGRVHHTAFVGPLAGFLVHFSPDFLCSAGGEAGARAVAGFHRVAPVPLQATATVARVGELFALLEAEFGRVGPENNELLRHYLLIILLEMRREAGLARATSHDQAGRVVLDQFLALVEAHYATTKPVSAYAALLHITPNYLNALIKRTTGRTAGQLIRDRVMLEAKRLLLYSDATVAEVALSLGYDDASYFWRLFKKAVLVSPTEFRKRNAPL